MIKVSSYTEKNHLLTSKEISRSSAMSFSFILLAVIMVLQFVPIPAVWGLPIAPMNAVFYIVMLYAMYALTKILRFQKSALIFLSVLTVYYVAKQALFFIKGIDQVFLYDNIRDVLYVLLIMLVCKDSGILIKSSKIFVVLSCLSVIFGMLVYFIGGPFTSIRSWLVQSMSSSEIRIAVRSQLTGIYCLPAIFGYLMASVPILCYGIYSVTKKTRWLIMLIILLMGLVLNAERSALLMNCIVFFVWFRKMGKNPFKIVGFCLVLYCIMAVGAYAVKVIIDKPSARHDSRYQYGTLMERMEGSESKQVVSRILYPVNGIKAVLRHPLLGATKAQYEASFTASQRRSLGLSPGDTILYPHNHYINTGLHAGLLGWGVTLYFFYRLRKMHREGKRMVSEDPQIKLLYTAVSLSLFAVMGNALFHNAGIFTGEFASCSMLGFFLAMYQIGKNRMNADAH